MTCVRGVTQWYRDPVSCLQSTLATLLLEAGHDPLEVLGLSWEFRYHPGDVRPEEYYWPCRRPGDLAGSLLPLHDVTSRWRAIDPADPLGAWRDALAGGRLPVVAVDNYHLPFRPAYHDVHAAHLLVVYDVDETAGTVAVSDAMPPDFAGPLPAEVLLRSCGAAGVDDEQDVFFSGPVTSGGRWLDVRLPAAIPALDPGRLGLALDANAAGFAAPSDDAWTGADGLRRYCAQLGTAATPELLAEAYTFGWGMQAQASLHGELLRTLGARWDRPALAEAGRRVEQVAHRWTAVRVTAAHGRDDPAGCAGPLRDHLGRLRRAYQEAHAALGRAAADLR
ncbi:BtrH N-terminal domain-containing protein [Plantactinospora sp. DSM 117369]